MPVLITDNDTQHNASVKRAVKHGAAIIVCSIVMTVAVLLFYASVFLTDADVIYIRESIFGG